MAKIAIAGASGFVGKHLGQALAARGHTVVGLTRSVADRSQLHGASEWRPCDLFSAASVSDSLKDVDYAFYLVHSMSKSARLTQATFEDCDLLAALNFSWACEKRKIKQIIYLGGLIPPEIPEQKLSRHLRSRLEVERALASTSVPVTTLRSGLIIGAEGSSFQIMYRLAKHLRIMVTPRWTQNPTTPIWLEDVIELLQFVLNRPECSGQTYDIGGPNTMPYSELLATTAQALHKQILFISFPFFSPKLSRLWVTLISGQSPALVAPLVESLKYPMVPRDRKLQEMAGIPGRSVTDAITKAVDTLAQKKSARLDSPPSTKRHAFPTESTVHSIQRITSPEHLTSHRMGSLYFRWVNETLFFTRVVEDKNEIRIRLRIFGWTLLKFRRHVDEMKLDVYFIAGGLLAQKGTQGFLEFRPVPRTNLILSIVASFRPRLPWLIYKYSQALVHLIVMFTFARHIARTRSPL